MQAYKSKTPSFKIGLLLKMLSIAITSLLACTLLVTAEAAYQTPIYVDAERAKICSTRICLPPMCRCSGLTLPKPAYKGHEKEIPQVG